MRCTPRPCAWGSLRGQGWGSPKNGRKWHQVLARGGALQGSQVRLSGLSQHILQRETRRPLVHRTGKYDLCGSKPPNVWPFVTAAPGHLYRCPQVSRQEVQWTSSGGAVAGGLGWAGSEEVGKGVAEASGLQWGPWGATVLSTSGQHRVPAVPRLAGLRVQGQEDPGYGAPPGPSSVSCPEHTALLSLPKAR